MTTTCLLAWAAALLLLPIIIVLWATESREQRIRRWRSYGLTQVAIAERLGVTRYQVRKALG